MSIDTTYLVPLRAAHPPSDDFVRHLTAMSLVCPVVVVDSSDEEVFAGAAEAFGGRFVHVRPDPDHRCANGKVWNVLSGLDLVTTRTVTIADDDVRHTAETLQACVDSIGDAELVRPQNHFVTEHGGPLAWHAVWDTARTLVNRVTGGDMPGTLVVDTQFLRDTGGYDGDVLFENLELMRTVQAAGGRCQHRPDIYVPRRPPTTSHFLGQRVRQAYDEFARPWRLAVQLAIVPVLAASSKRGGARRVLALTAATIGAAELGRRRDQGATHFPGAASWLAPWWVLERGVCSWLAVAARLRGGVRYAGGRLPVAAHTQRSIEAVLALAPMCTIAMSGRSRAR